MMGAESLAQSSCLMQTSGLFILAHLNMSGMADDSVDNVQAFLIPLLPSIRYGTESIPFSKVRLA